MNFKPIMPIALMSLLFVGCAIASKESNKQCKPLLNKEDKLQETQQLNQLIKRLNQLERQLAKNPYDKKVADELREIYKKTSMVGLIKRTNDNLDRSTPIDWERSEAVFSESDRRPYPKKSGRFSEIVFKRLSFKNVGIVEVLKHLSEESKRLDEKGQGVNIDLNMGAKELATVPNITMDMEDVTLTQAIEIICKMTATRCRVRKGRLEIINDPIAVGRIKTINESKP